MSGDAARRLHQHPARAPLEVRLLGPVHVERDGEPTALGSTRHQTLLALLALTPGQPVDADLLVTELWPDAVPQDPRAALHIVVSRLRGRVAPGGPRPGPVRREQSGYVLDVAPEQVDLLRFHEHAATALTVEALDPADRALAEWRGEPFLGCSSPRLDIERSRAQERHLRVNERRASTLLGQGRPAEALEGLVGLLDAHRDREALTELVMTALYRSARQPEALAVFEETRRHLRDHYGLDPGPDLIALHRRILLQDSSLGGERPRSRRRRAPLLARDAELASILEPLRGDGAVVVTDGEAGIGKTALARVALDQAERQGARVGQGRFDDDGDAFSAWTDALRAAGGGRLADVTGSGTTPTRLAELSGWGPTLLVLEDAHRADAPSLGLLRRSASNLPGGFVVLVTARHPDSETHPLWSGVLADLAREPAVTHLRLELLPRLAVDTLVERRLADRLDPGACREIAEAVWRRSEGHPLHVSALLDLAAAAPDAERAREAVESLPDRLRPLFDHQLARVPEACRQLLEGLAVLGPIPPPALAAAAGRSELQTLLEIGPAVDAGLVEAVDVGFAFRHELTAAAVREAVPAATRQGWQRASGTSPSVRRPRDR